MLTFKIQVVKTSTKLIQENEVCTNGHFTILETMEYGIFNFVKRIPEITEFAKNVANIRTK